MIKEFDFNSHKQIKKMKDETILYQNIKTQEYVVVKEIRQDIPNFSQTLDIIEGMNHSTIARLRGYIEPKSGHNYRLVMDYYPKGSLSDLISSLAAGNAPENWSNTKLSIIIYGIADAIQCIHKNNLIHGNIKPTNILLDENYCPKVSDIGVSQLSQYSAPEILTRSPYNKDVDIYSFGIVFCYMLVQELPFDESLTLEDLVQFIPEGERPILPGNIPEHIQNFVEKCWNEDPKERPSIEYVTRVLTEERFFFPETDHAEFEKYQQDIAKSEKPAVPEGNPMTVYKFGLMLKKKSSNRMNDAINYFKFAADNGIVEAMYEYAKLTQNEDYFKKAAENGNVEAMYEFAEIQKHKKNPSVARHFYQLAGQAGNTRALLEFTVLSNLSKEEKISNYKKAADDGIPYGAYLYFKETGNIKYLKQASEGDVIEAVYEYGHLMRESKPGEAAKYLKQAADAGINEAAYEFGLIMQTCKTPLQKTDEIMPYFRQAADGGIPGAAYQLFLYLHNISHNESDAQRYLEIAAEKNYFPALYRLSLNLMFQDKDPDSRKNAAINMRRAAETNDLDAMYHYAILRKNGGQNIKRNLKDTEKYLTKAANEGGNMYAMYEVALILTDRNDSGAIQYLKRAADTGHPDSMYQYAMIMKTSPKPTKQTQAEATKYFKMALEYGVTDQAYQQALALQTSKSSKLKQEEIIDNFKKLQNNPNACYQLALIYQSMEGTPGSGAQAANFMKQAADNGHTDAAYRYGLMSLTGAAGCKKNVLVSAEYLKNAADHGHRNAMYQYALMKHYGYGIMADQVEASKYFKMCADEGNIDSMYQYAISRKLKQESEAVAYLKKANSAQF